VQGLISTGAARYATDVLRLAWAGEEAAIRQRPSGAGIGCLMGGMVGTFLQDRRWSHVFLAGVFTGLLPCGLVYAYVALAASTSDPIGGMVTMASFGVGTMPMMVLVGCGSTLFSLAGRRRVLYIAAWCVVLTGLLSIARGIGFLELTPGAAAAGCPLCNGWEGHSAGR
jgi:hypothetical protein